MDTLLTPRQVAEMFSVSPRTVYLWIEQGRLPALKLSERVTRIRREDVEQLAAPPMAAEASVVYSAGSGGEADLIAAELPVAYMTSAPSSDVSDYSRSLRDLLSRHRDAIIEAAYKHRASNVRVFGSVARGDATEASDIDLLVDLAPGASLFDLMGLSAELERLLGRSVDVVQANGTKRQVPEHVLRGANEL